MATTRKSPARPGAAVALLILGGCANTHPAQPAPARVAAHLDAAPSGSVMAAAVDAREEQADDEAAERRIEAAETHLTESVRHAATCLPATVGPRTAAADGDEADTASGSPEMLGLQLGVMAGKPVACVVRGHPPFPPDRPLACWDLDLATGAMTSRAAAPLPGRGYAVAFDRDCADGYCLPSDEMRDAPEPDERYTLATSTDGQRAVLWTAMRGSAGVVFDQRSRRVVAAIDASDDEGSADDAIVALAFVGSRIVRTGANAGIDERFLGWTATGKRARMTAAMEEAGLQVLSDHELGFVSALGTVLTTIDVASGRRRVATRVIAECNAQDREHLRTDALEAAAVRPACAAVWPRVGAPYVGAEWIHLPGGAYAVALTGAQVGELAILDGRTLRETRRVPLARCAP